VITQQTDVTAFEGILVGGVFDVLFTYDDEHSIEVEMRENLFEHLRIDVRNNVLRVNFANNVTINFAGTRPQVRITAPYIKSATFSGVVVTTGWDVIEAERFTLSVSGASDPDMSFRVDELTVTASGTCRVRVIGVTADSVTATASGASTISLNGTSPRLTARASGTSRVLANGLASTRAALTASGSSQIEANVTVDLRATASGSSRITYSGNPASTNKNTSGTGSVVQR
jgi:hypothetical protein